MDKLIEDMYAATRRWLTITVALEDYSFTGSVFSELQGHLSDTLRALEFLRGTDEH